MNRSIKSRRDFLRSSGAFLAGGVALAATDAEAGKRQDGSKVLAETATEQSENGIVFYSRRPSDLMNGMCPPMDKRVTLDNWCDTTDTTRWTNFNASTVFKSVPIDRGTSPVWILQREMLDPERVARSHVLWGRSPADSTSICVRDWLKRTETDAFLVLHNGRIVVEQYFGEMTPHTRHAIFSASKSILASVVARFLADGTLNEDEMVTRYVPEFRDTAFEGATIRQLLDMQAGIAYRSFLSPAEFEKLDQQARKEWSFGSPEMRKATHECAESLRMQGFFRKLPTEDGLGVYDFLLTLKQNRPHGSYFDYSEPNVIGLQAALEKATGTPYVEHLAKFMQELGVERSPQTMIDEIGTPIGNCGLQMTARDLGRWGQALCNGGHVRNGEKIPGLERFVDDIMATPNSDKWSEKTNVWGLAPTGTGYRNLCWTSPVEKGFARTVHAAGLYGQRVFIRKPEKVVLVKVASNQTSSENAKDEVAARSFMDLVAELVEL